MQKTEFTKRLILKNLNNLQNHCTHPKPDSQNCITCTSNLHISASNRLFKFINIQSIIKIKIAKETKLLHVSWYYIIVTIDKLYILFLRHKLWYFFQILMFVNTLLLIVIAGKASIRYMGCLSSGSISLL